MKITTLKVASWLGLVLTLLPSLFVFTGVLTLEGFKTIVLVGSLLWLATAPFWINRDPSEES
jgi:hypothetical protein